MLRFKTIIAVLDIKKVIRKTGVANAILNTTEIANSARVPEKVTLSTLKKILRREVKGFER